VTRRQIDLMHRAIVSEVAYWRARVDREFPLPRREIELLGHDRRAARKLIDAGLLDYAGSDHPHQTWVQLHTASLSTPIAGGAS
jgi:hypothetical protein